MAIPANVARIALVGTQAGEDVFETGFWVAGLPIASAAEANEAAADVKAAIVASTFPAAFENLVNITTVIDQVRVYAYPAGGPTATWIGAAAYGLAGTKPVVLPLQVACCMTLNTGMAGRSKRGRMYLPANAVGVSDVSHLTATPVNAARVGLADAMSRINDIGDFVQCVVVSQTLSSFAPIVSVSSDLKPDIQRRRANAVVAAKTTTALT